MSMTRREAILSLSTAVAAATAYAAPAAPPEAPAAVVAGTDAAVDFYLRSQVTEPGQWLGSMPDDYMQHPVGATGGLIETMTTALIHPASKHHNENELVNRIRLAAGFLERSQSPEGFIDGITTNFNSPPDTAFVVINVGTAAAIAKLYANDTVLGILRPFLVKAGNGMAVGGIHTPNHRWVVSSSLAQIHDVFPNPAYPKRIEQWLAEGIDIDDDGQYTERSTVTYDPICDRAFTVLAAKLKQPDLLDPVRRNLRAMMYMLHPDGEVVTEISRRQDQFGRGTMASYWFPLQYLAMHDGDAQFATLARQLGVENTPLSALMEYPDLAGTLPAGAPLPEDYEKQFPQVGLARIRRGELDGTVILQNSSRFFSARKGPLVVNAVRFATSFFGKGQFIPGTTVKRDGGYVGTQSLEAPYYQPLTPALKVTAQNWEGLRDKRPKTQICKLEQSATLKEKAGGFELRIQASGNSGGTPIGVPLAVEISLREGGKLEGCRPAPHVDGAWVLQQGYATYTVEGKSLRFGPGAASHLLAQLRGAEAKLPGVSVYLTGYTPFDKTISFDFS
jgi:hypothetical protein